MGDVWAQIAGFPNYAVSSNGAVMRLTEGKGTRMGRILKPRSNSQGYLRINLYDSQGKIHVAKVHRLVATHHVPNLDGLPMVNHMDGVKTNNTSPNLEWCTQSHNTKHAYGMGLIKNMAKLTPEQVREIRALYTQHGVSQQFLSKQFGIAPTTVAQVVNHITWKHVRP